VLVDSWELLGNTGRLRKSEDKTGRMDMSGRMGLRGSCKHKLRMGIGLARSIVHRCNLGKLLSIVGS